MLVAIQTKRLIASASDRLSHSRAFAVRKSEELRHRIARGGGAASHRAIPRLPKDDPLNRPKIWATVRSYLGVELADAHAALTPPPRASRPDSHTPATRQRSRLGTTTNRHLECRRSLHAVELVEPLGVVLSHTARRATSPSRSATVTVSAEWRFRYSGEGTGS
jgi:hypothetical protein